MGTEKGFHRLDESRDDVELFDVKQEGKRSKELEWIRVVKQGRVCRGISRVGINEGRPMPKVEKEKKHKIPPKKKRWEKKAIEEKEEKNCWRIKPEKTISFLPRSFLFNFFRLFSYSLFFLFYFFPFYLFLFFSTNRKAFPTQFDLLALERS